MRSFFLSVFALTLLSAQILVAHESPSVRALSFGGAYRAVANSNDTIFYNPAGLIKYQRLGVDASYLIHQKTGAYEIGASVVDSKTTSWGLGLAYSAGVEESLKSTHLFNLAVAMPIIGERLSLGTSVYYNYDRNQENFRHFFNMDVGLMASLPLGLCFALVADHLIPPKGNEKGFGLALGLAFDLGQVLEVVPLTISFDWLMEDLRTKERLHHVLGLGAEYIFFGLIPVRVGYMSRPRDGVNLISLGAGIKVPIFSLDALYQQHLSVGKIRNFGIAVRLDF